MSYDPGRLVFIDVETTGLDLEHHEVWEIAIIYWSDQGNGWQEHDLHIWPADLQKADPDSLRVNRFYERTDLPEVGGWDRPHDACEFLARVTSGRTLVGACPWFDAAFVEKLLIQNRFASAWDYHMVDIESLVIGYLFHKPLDLPGGVLKIPWRHADLIATLGIERRSEEEKHTALGDVRQVHRAWLKIMGDPARAANSDS